MNLVHTLYLKAPLQYYLPISLRSVCSIMKGGGFLEEFSGSIMLIRNADGSFFQNDREFVLTTRRYIT
jgi:hypothetical protein